MGRLYNDSDGFTNNGILRIYEYTPSGVTSWTQLGVGIKGEADDDWVGTSASLSSEGSRVAVGAQIFIIQLTMSGTVKIYDYTPSGVSSWTQVGSDIVGEAVADQFGSVSLSSDGKKLL